MLTAHLEQQLNFFLGQHLMFSLLGEDGFRRLVQKLEMVSFAM